MSCEGEKSVWALQTKTDGLMGCLAVLILVPCLEASRSKSKQERSYDIHDIAYIPQGGLLLHGTLQERDQTHTCLCYADWKPEMGKVQLNAKSNCVIFVITSGHLDIPVRCNICRRTQRAIPNGCPTLMALKVFSWQFTEHILGLFWMPFYYWYSPNLDMCGLTADMGFLYPICCLWILLFCDCYCHS